MAACRAAAGGTGCFATRGGTVEAVQVVVLHQLDELRPVLRVGGVDTGQRRGERIRVPALGHCIRIVGAARQQPAVGVDALGDVLVDLERRGEIHDLTVDHLLGRLLVTACRTGSLDPEQVVVVGRQDALSPAGLVDGLGNGDGGGHAVLALSRHGAAGDLVDEGLLGGRAWHARAAQRHVVPMIRGQRAGLARVVPVRPLEQAGDGGLARPCPLRPGRPEPCGRHVRRSGPVSVGVPRALPGSVCCVTRGRLEVRAVRPRSYRRLIAYSRRRTRSGSVLARWHRPAAVQELRPLCGQCTRLRRIPRPRDRRRHWYGARRKLRLLAHGVCSAHRARRGGRIGRRRGIGRGGGIARRRGCGCRTPRPGRRPSPVPDRPIWCEPPARAASTCRHRCLRIRPRPGPAAGPRTRAH